MSARNIPLYAGPALRPQGIAEHLTAVKSSGCTTINLGLFHIGNPEVRGGTNLGDIIFNDNDPLVIRGGAYVADPAWPGRIAQLKAPDSLVTKIYASCGGASPPVYDFETIKTIYNKNKQSFSGTQLETNFRTFHETFKAIDGIDMDSEECYDVTSFVAFCKMLIDIGFGITFCPFEHKKFWTDSLKQVEEVHPGAVEWWNLQCYAGGWQEKPDEWAAAIKEAFPERSTDGYILASDWCRFYDPDRQDWSGDCPQDMQKKISGFSKLACFGGAFIWSMDLILASQEGFPVRGNGCKSQKPILLSDYVNAITQAMK
jgi:hypothetical protein